MTESENPTVRPFDPKWPFGVVTVKYTRGDTLQIETADLQPTGAKQLGCGCFRLTFARPGGAANDPQRLVDGAAEMTVLTGCRGHYSQLVGGQP